ncbi:hypothetical protein KFE25_012694 [Diacronema lutheri]|uniref:Uncharacterized protein n=1 Tax=Diacronema lutheri TaxID=2081491 RepID=A0A8J6C0Z9_DIALT|nr:hypothetical protein KFE25_012694 [Diacronema lutheri]
MPEQPESCAQLDTDASHGSPCTSEDNRTASAAPSAQREAKRLWTPAEDEQLVLVVHKYGASRWSLIATHVPGRAGKQCRERWFNHLCPEVKKGEWSAEEDETLLRAVAELGSQWSIIVKRMHGRTDNAIKNRYNTIQRRARSTHAHSPAPSHRLASVPCWASPDGASPGSGSDSADTAGTPKRARDDADDPVGADADAAGFGVDESFSEVFGALLEGMPPTPAIAASRPAPAVGPSAPLLLHAAQCRRERLTALAAELASCDATDPDQHGAIDALIEQLAAAAGPPEACVRGKELKDRCPDSVNDDACKPLACTDPDNVGAAGAKSNLATADADGFEAAGGARPLQPSCAPFGCSGREPPSAQRTHSPLGGAFARSPPLLPAAQRTRRASAGGGLAAAAHVGSRARRGSALSLAPLQIDEPAPPRAAGRAAVGDAVGTPPKRQRGEESDVERMIASLFPDASLSPALPLVDVPLPPTPCAADSGGTAKLPLTPSAMLNSFASLVDAF